MTEVTALIQAAVDKSPTDFAAAFQDLMQGRIESALENRQIEIAQGLYGEPVAPDATVPDVDVNVDLDDLANADIGVDNGAE